MLITAGHDPAKDPNITEIPKTKGVSVAISQRQGDLDFNLPSDDKLTRAISVPKTYLPRIIDSTRMSRDDFYLILNRAEFNSDKRNRSVEVTLSVKTEDGQFVPVWLPLTAELLLFCRWFHNVANHLHGDRENQ